MNDEVRRAVADLLASIPAQDQESRLESVGDGVSQRLKDEGWARVGLPEELGGAGGDINDAAAVVAACAASAHHIALADTFIVTGRCLELAQLSLPVDADCVLALPRIATVDAAGELHVEVSRAPAGRCASHFLVIAGESSGATVHLVDAAYATITVGYNLAEQPRDSITLSGAPSTVSASTDRSVEDVLHQMQLAGALTRSIQIAAAADVVLELCTTYCSDRWQFGRRLTAFQAVQQELAALKGEAAAAAAAVDHALDAATLDRSTLPCAPIAAAKARAGMAAGATARSAHQLHGAIGITLEYPLHRYTRALWSWRDEWGGESHWAARLLAEVMPDGSADPWERLTAV